MANAMQARVENWWRDLVSTGPFHRIERIDGVTIGKISDECVVRPSGAHATPTAGVAELARTRRTLQYEFSRKTFECVVAFDVEVSSDAFEEKLSTPGMSIAPENGDEHILFVRPLSVDYNQPPRSGEGGSRFKFTLTISHQPGS